jgi:hypothetical protein
MPLMYASMVSTWIDIIGDYVCPNFSLHHCHVHKAHNIYRIRGPKLSQALYFYLFLFFFSLSMFVVRKIQIPSPKQSL